MNIENWPLIKELEDGNRYINVSYLVQSANKCTSKTGKPYLNIVLEDSSGTIDARKWEVEEGDEELFSSGTIVMVDGVVSKYGANNTLQFKIDKAIKSPVDPKDPRFAPQAPVSTEELAKKLEWYLISFKNEDVSILVNYLIKKHYEDYLFHAAAVRNHHNYVSGLLYHSLSMADSAEALCKLYPSLNRDVLVGGCLIHDLGKLQELSDFPTSYTLDGKLLGHIHIEVAEIREACRILSEENPSFPHDEDFPAVIQHMIEAHHGIPEFGSAVLPLTREALALSMIDDFDAKMNIIDKALDGIEPGEWSAKIFPLDNRMIYKPLYNGKKDK